MYDFNFIDLDDGLDSTWKDLPFTALAVTLLLNLLLLFMVNPAATQSESEESKTPGNVIVEAVWNSQRDCDVDLWVQAPGDSPVGYSAKSGKIFNLLRDDLGRYNDISDVNLENVYSRGIAEGEYCVNVHYYRSDNGTPIEVTLVVRVKENGDAPSKQVVATKVNLLSLGQELTAFRFKLTKEGKLVEGSIHHVFKPLRSQGQGNSR